MNIMWKDGRASIGGDRLGLPQEVGADVVEKERDPAESTLPMG